MQVQSIWSYTARQAAADLIADEQPIVAYNRSVCAILGRGESPTFHQAVAQIKGEARKTKPLGIFTRVTEIVEWLDPTRIPPNLHHILLDPDEFLGRLGSLCFLRLPVREAVVETLPPHLLSRTADGTPVVMACDPSGQPSFDNLLDLLHTRGVRYLAGTSLNPSGQPEMVDKVAGIAFARACGVRLFLDEPDNNPRLQGSPTILSVEATGVRLIRDGYIPTAVFEWLLGMPIARAGARPTRYPQLRVSLDGVPPREQRQTLLAYLNRRHSSHEVAFYVAVA
jgi:tRNA A37 threonylcarbamoyladenosine synthetase subunit TsaC/SUA5/YrdC